MPRTLQPPASRTRPALHARVEPAVMAQVKALAYGRKLTISETTRQLLDIALEQVQASR